VRRAQVVLDVAGVLVLVLVLVLVMLMVLLVLLVVWRSLVLVLVLVLVVHMWVRWQHLLVPLPLGRVRRVARGPRPGHPQRRF